MWTRLFACLLFLVGVAVGGGASRAPLSRGEVLVGPPDEMQRKLERQLPEVSFVRTPLDAALATLRDRGDVNLVMNLASIEASGIDLKAPISLSLKNVSVQEALESVLFAGSTRTATLTFNVEGNVIQIGENLHRRLETRVYDLAPMIRSEQLRWQRLRTDKPRSAEEIVEDTTRAIQEITDDGVSDEGNRGSIQEFGGRLIVVSSPSGHRRIARLLEQLERSDRPLPDSDGVATRPTTHASTRSGG